MTTAKMSEEEALQYIAASPTDSPIFQKALIALNRQDNRKTRAIAWVGLAVSMTSLATSILTVVLKIR